MTTERSDIYARVTNQILEAIERGTEKYRMPWHTSGEFAFSPINAVSKKAYRGINTLVLAAAAIRHGYTAGIWGTYKQWQDLGAQVRKGEKATAVVFWKFSEIEAESEDSEERSSKTIPFAREYHVFNAGQVDGYDTPKVEPVNSEERIQGAEAFFASTGTDVRHGGNQAFYSSETDHIQLPDFEMFKDAPAYYSVRGHETIHWSGAPHRLDRNLLGRFGDCSYAMEELVAELGAAFLSAELGLSNEPRVDHAPYVASWLRALRNDKRAIFTAASAAQKAADFIVQISSQREAAA